MTKVWALINAWLQLDFFGKGDSEDRSGSSLTTTIFTQAFIALVLATLIFDGDARPVAFAAANLSLSTMLIGMSVIADQESFSRRSADRVLLGTAPISRHLLPLARALHAGFKLCLVTTGMALAPAILLYWVAGRQLWVIPAYLIMASMLSGLLAASFHLGIKILLRTLGPGSTWLIAGTIRGVLLAGLVLAMATCLPHLQGSVEDLPLGRLGALAWPPYWAARWLAAPIEASIFGMSILCHGVALYCGFVMVGDGEHHRQRRGSGKTGLLDRIERSLAGRGPLLGSTAFVGNMLYRSPGFRARVLPLFGLPLAMILLAFSSEQRDGGMILLGICLQFPAIYLPFLILFLPQADHEASSWLFETSPGHNIELARVASLIAISSRILLPVHGLAAVLMLAGGVGVMPTLALASFSLGSAVLLAGLQLRSLTSMPFTVEGEALEGGMEFGSLIGLGMLLAMAGAAFAMIADQFVGLAAGLIMAGLALRHLRSAPARCHAN